MSALRVSAVTNDSSLGRWTYHECRPAHLANTVQLLWHFEGKTSLPRERSFPKGYTELILHLGPRFHDVRADGTRGDLFPALCFSGPQTKPLVIEAPDAACCVLGIHLHAVGGFQVLGTSPSEATNATLNLADAVANASDELTEACLEANSVDERFAIVCRWIEQRLSGAPRTNAAIERAAKQLLALRGRVPIEVLQREAGLSRARFVSLFREQVGLAPKQLARVLRFRNALAMLQTGQRLSTVALESGYYDQAHMHLDFSEFSGITPTEFLRAARFPNSASLPEVA